MRFFGGNRTLFRIFGIPIKLNLSWLLLLSLIVYSLGARGGLFRQWLGGTASEGTYWVLALVGALGLFASLIVHELCHSIVARHTGTPVSGITLFIFGGVSELRDEPPTAEAEFMMAVVGPLSSLIIGTFCLVVAFLSWPASVKVTPPLPGLARTVIAVPPTVWALFLYLGIINIMLAVFNSIPAFPLDGGRIVRSVLWGITGNLRTATTIAANIGSAFGMAMIIGGFLSLIYGGLSVIGGIWIIFIGFFLRQAASSSLQQTVMRQGLSGEVVSRFMTSNIVTVPPDLSLRRFVDEYVLPHHFAVFPTVDEQGRLIGIVHSRDPAKVNQSEWDNIKVGSIMRQVSRDIQLDASTDAVEALARLTGEEGRRLIVVDSAGRPIGIVSLRDMLDFLALKIDLSPRTR